MEFSFIKDIISHMEIPDGKSIQVKMTESMMCAFNRWIHTECDIKLPSSLDELESYRFREAPEDNSIPHIEVIHSDKFAVYVKE